MLLSDFSGLTLARALHDRNRRQAILRLYASLFARTQQPLAPGLGGAFSCRERPHLAHHLAEPRNGRGGRYVRAEPTAFDVVVGVGKRRTFAISYVYARGR